MNKHRELLTSIRRYYSNAFTDRAKQDAINLFLGYYVPNSTDKPLWELDTDYYLHNFHAENASLQSMREYKKDQYCLDQDEVNVNIVACIQFYKNSLFSNSSICASSFHIYYVREIVLSASSRVPSQQCSMSSSRALTGQRFALSCFVAFAPEFIIMCCRMIASVRH